MLAPGGRLLYCTCSVLPAENEAVLARFLAPEPAARAWSARRSCPRAPSPGRSGSSFYPEERQAPTASIMLVSKRQRPEPERLIRVNCRHDHDYAPLIRTRSRVRVMLAAVFLAAWAASRVADALDGVLEVRSAYVNVDNGVFLLHARVEYPVNPDDPGRVARRHHADLRSRHARRARAPLLVRRRGRRADAAPRADLSRGHRSYLVRDARSGEQEASPPSRRRSSTSARVDGWPILVEPQLDGGSYQVSVRAGVRRGRMPASLRALLFWTDDWHRTSEWYSWSLPV